MTVFNVSEISSNCCKGHMSNLTYNSLMPLSSSIIVSMRILSLLIILENFTVAVCLYTQRNRFTKKEFWLMLLCLSLNDFFCGLALFEASFIEHDFFGKHILHCSPLIAISFISELCLLYNIISICLYRFIFLFCVDKYRLRWKTKQSCIQGILIFVCATIYVAVPFLLWGETDIDIEMCTFHQVFRDKMRYVSFYMGAGFLLPLMFVNIIYGITFAKLRQKLNDRDSVKLRYRAKRFSLVKEATSSNSAVKSELSIRLTKRGRGDDIITSDTPVFKEMLQSADPSDRTLIDPGNNSEDNTELRRGVVADEKYTVKDRIMEVPRLSQAGNECKSNDEDVCENILQCEDPLSDARGVRNLADIDNNEGRNKKVSSSPVSVYQRQSIKLIGLILLLINVTSWPALSLLFLIYHLSDWDATRTTTAVVQCILFANSVLNPCVYTFQSREFRDMLKTQLHSITQL